MKKDMKKELNTEGDIKNQSIVSQLPINKEDIKVSYIFNYLDSINIYSLNYSYFDEYRINYNRYTEFIKDSLFLRRYPILHSPQNIILKNTAMINFRKTELGKCKLQISIYYNKRCITQVCNKKPNYYATINANNIFDYNILYKLDNIPLCSKCFQHLTLACNIMNISSKIYSISIDIYKKILNNIKKLPDHIWKLIYRFVYFY
jgi:hypothetical protein